MSRDGFANGGPVPRGRGVGRGVRSLIFHGFSVREQSTYDDGGARLR